jgi:hypothetical protein
MIIIARNSHEYLQKRSDNNGEVTEEGISGMVEKEYEMMKEGVLKELEREKGRIEQEKFDRFFDFSRDLEGKVVYFCKG